MFPQEAAWAAIGSSGKPAGAAMKLIYGRWSKCFDVGWPPIIAAVTVAAYAVSRYATDASEATALGVAALGAMAMTVLILLVSEAVDNNVTERVENSGVISAVAGADAAAAAAFLGICFVCPITLSIACAILFPFSMVVLYGNLQKEIDDSEWWWGWRKSLLALALIVGFAVLHDTGNWVFASFALFVVLMAQGLWTIRLWVRPARVPA